MAGWLNSAFAGLDGGVFRALNVINCEFLNVFCKYFSYIGEKGIPLILVGLILCCFAKTRKIGVGVLFGIAIGAVFTNLLIKNLVARPRPYVTSTEFNGFWQASGAVEESEFSFPSGHTTASTAFAVAIFVMGFCRVYLVVHYTTDVIAGLLVGSIAGILAYYLVNLVNKLFQKHKENKFCDFALNRDITYLFKKEKSSKENDGE